MRSAAARRAAAAAACSALHSMDGCSSEGGWDKVRVARGIGKGGCGENGCCGGGKGGCDDEGCGPARVEEVRVESHRGKTLCRNCCTQCRSDHYN